MNVEHRFFEISPRIVRAGAEAEIVIRPLHEHVRFRRGARYRVEHHLMDGPQPGSSSPVILDRTVRPSVDGALRIRSLFPGEQEHWLRITTATRGEWGLDVRLYSLLPDLFARRPYKGDVHLHSFRSDGRESPAYVAAAGRQIGLDFLAVTDHGRYAPSQEAIAAFRGVTTDLALFTGEEVHPPEVPVHMINFGGRFSVNALFDTARYRREVKRLAATLARTLPTGVVPGHAAGTLWALAKIRGAGGLSVFCHPHWINGCAYNVAEALNDWLFQERPFDVFELTGGYWRSQIESNQLQAAWYTEQIARGRTVPVVGASDAHGCHNGLFGWYYTIAFARNRGDLLDSMREGWSVAVEELPGDTMRPRGPYRLVKFALFLGREVFPAHDELCVEEGRLMVEHAAGVSGAAAGLRRLSGRCGRYYRRVYDLVHSSHGTALRKKDHP